MRSRVVTAAGSSPLARGLRPGYYWEADEPRIIPARAGFTRPMTGAPTCGPDHPRSRGVYEELPLDAIAQWGSSPLARGLRDPREPGRGRRGIIPARAGFTGSPARLSRADRDHPRSRGVYLCATPPTAGCPGSSPLARGLQYDAASNESVYGIIPARAGFTAARAAAPGFVWDHPRSRGVY